MGENLAFFLPITMTSFGVVFFIIWTWRVRSAGSWSGAYFCIGSGFAIPIVTAVLPSAPWAIIANLLFTSGFFLIGQALLDRWRPNWLLSLRLSILALSLLLCVAAVALDDLAVELAALNFSCFLLTALPMIAGKDHLDNRADCALFASAALISLDNLVRGCTIPLILPNGDLQNSDYFMLAQTLGCIFGIFQALTALAAMMLDLLTRYQRDALHDPLSGLLNRRGFDEAVAWQARKGKVEGSLIVCDIDHFKRINDEYGHALGDRVIAALARTLVGFAPACSITARFGGEEFVLFLPGLNAARAAGIANSIRESLSQEVGDRLGLAHPLTASFGLSVVQHGDNSIHDAIARADEALYEAKARGRDRLCVRRALAAPDRGDARPSKHDPVKLSRRMI